MHNPAASEADVAAARQRRRALWAVSTPEDLATVLDGLQSPPSLKGVCRHYPHAGRVVTQAVWARGDLLRVEEPPGTVDTVVGEASVWHRFQSTGHMVKLQRNARVSNPYRIPQILQRRSVDFWRGLIATDPAPILGSVSERVLHRRLAIAVTVPGKAGPFLLTVDKRTGVWLEVRRGGRSWLDWEWVVFDEVLEDDLFTL